MQRFLHSPAILIVAIAVLGACTTASAPTLPIPPPTALSSTPDGDGFVTISGMGAIEGAMVSAYNEQLEVGVIGVADDLGGYTLQIRADIGNTIVVWQRIGTETSGLVTVIVPSS